MNSLAEWKGKTDDCSIRYDLVIPNNELLIDSVDVSSVSSEAFEKDYLDNHGDVSCTKLNKKEKADRLDCEIAVACGLLSGVMDSIWVGEFDYKRANIWGKEEVEKHVVHVAKKTGYKKDDLQGAIKHLENMAPFVGDKYKDAFGGGLQHHMRDFGHHFSIFGLAFSLLTQFTRKCYGTDVKGDLLIIDIEKTQFSDTRLIGKNIPEKLFLGTIQWYLHVVSDMAGSNLFAGEGTGIPGPIVSSMKMMAALPIFKLTDEKGRRVGSVMVQKLFNGTLIAIKDENGRPIRFDLRQEIGILHETMRQSRPIIINECLVRALFSVRRLYKEIKHVEIKNITDVQLIDFRKTIPWNNRALQRMLTISTGTFEVVDLCDAAIRAAIQNKGASGAFIKDFALRINFIGIGRFVIAVKNDGRYILEDIDETKEEKERQKIAKNKEAFEYERTITKLDAFILTKEQYRILNSIKLQIIDYDINNTKDIAEAERKAKWKKEWKKSIITRLDGEVTNSSFAFKSEEKLYKQIALERKKENSLVWLYVIALELITFKPYFSLNSKEDRDYKSLKIKANYLKTTFPIKQPYINQRTLNELESAEKKSYNLITGKNNKTIAGIAGVTALMIITGGLASVFAPEIAVALVGESFAGIYGVALTNASLALLGGGSLAAGGMGMAGGTMVITGGASLLGMAGGSGIATSLALMSTEGYAANECAKLYTLSRAVLAEKYGAIGIIANLADLIDKQIGDLEDEINRLNNIEIKDKEEQEKAKKQAKIISKNMKYYRNCSKELKKLVNRYYSRAVAWLD